MADWLDAVVDVARDAALRDDRARLGWDEHDPRQPPFAYRWEHVQQVVRHARWLLGEVEADEDILIAAAWLHDVKKSEENHARRGATFAREFLPQTDFPPEKIEAVAGAIRKHAGLFRPSKKWRQGSPFRPASPLTPIETALLWDADKLTKIGPVALLHFLPYQLFELMRNGKSMTTEELHRQNKKWLRGIAPRIIASFNTLAAQQRARELHAAYDLFHATSRRQLDPQPGARRERRRSS